MAYEINEDCITCGTCKGECPTDAVQEGSDQYTINADLCIECGACAQACPVEAIHKAEPKK